MTEQESRTVASAPGMDVDLASLFQVAVHLDALGVKVIGVQWAEFSPPTIQVDTARDFQTIVRRFNLLVGDPYGTYANPVVAATGVINGLHMKIFGPVNR